MMEFGGHLCYGPSNKENTSFLVLLVTLYCEDYRNFLSRFFWQKFRESNFYFY